MFKEFGEARPLVSVEAFYKSSDVLPEGGEVGMQRFLDPIYRGSQDLLAPIARIGLTREEAVTLQPRHNTCDGTGSESGRGGQFAARHRASLTQNFQAFVVARSQSGPFRDTVVEQHNRCAEMSSHFQEETDVQFLAQSGTSNALRRSLSM
jgi:hypothetical protein